MKPAQLQELKELAVPELDKKIRDLRAELLNLTLRRTTGQVEKTHLLRELRRDIARCETFLAQKRSAAPAA